MRNGVYFVFVVVVVFIIVFLATAVPEGLAASFNCETAKSSAEKMICFDKGLSSLDEELQAAYHSAFQSQSDKKSLRDSQIKWLEEKRNACEDPRCMEKVYKNRIKELKELIAQNTDNILPKGVSKRYVDIAKSSNSNVCEFILTLAGEHLVDGFVEENLKAAKITNFDQISFQGGSDQYKYLKNEDADAFRFFINTKDPSTEIIWFRESAGSLNCQHDTYFKRNEAGKYDNSEELNKLLPWCSDGDCCGGEGQSLFQFGRKLYSYRYNYDESNNIRIDEITKNGFIKLCEFQISHSKIKNVELQCSDDKVCKEIRSYIMTNLNMLLNDTPVNDCKFTDFAKIRESGTYIDGENIQCCNNIDFNNDRLKDLACIRDFPLRFRGKVHLLQKEKTGEYHEIVTQWKNSFLDKHWNDDFGFNINLLFIKIGAYIYTIDYSFNTQKTPPIGTFEIYLVQGNSVNKVGKIIIELASPADTVLCTSEEKIIFSCPIGKKTLSVCASRDLSSNSGYLQYRFGTSLDKLELVFPQTKDHPRSHFRWATDSGPEWHAVELSFFVGQTEYIVFHESSFSEGTVQGVVVLNSGKLLACLECSCCRDSDDNLPALIGVGIPAIKIRAIYSECSDLRHSCGR